MGLEDYWLILKSNSNQLIRQNLKISYDKIIHCTEKQIRFIKIVYLKYNATILLVLAHGIFSYHREVVRPIHIFGTKYGVLSNHMV